MKRLLFLITLSLSLSASAQDFSNGEHFLTDHSNGVLYLSVSDDGYKIDEFAVATLEGETELKGEAEWMYQTGEHGEYVSTGYYAMRTRGTNGIKYALNMQADSIFVLTGPLDTDEPMKKRVYYLQSRDELTPAMSGPIEIEPVQEEEIHQFPDSLASFPGGNAHLMKWISLNVNYPEEALEAGVMGNVYVQFVIEKDGSITGIEIMRSPHELLSKEVIRLVKSMPKWKPAIHHGVPVRSRMTLPVRFRAD